MNSLENNQTEEQIEQAKQEMQKVADEICTDNINGKIIKE